MINLSNSHEGADILESRSHKTIQSVYRINRVAFYSMFGMQLSALIYVVFKEHTIIPNPIVFSSSTILRICLCLMVLISTLAGLTRPAIRLLGIENFDEMSEVAKMATLNAIAILLTHTIIFFSAFVVVFRIDVYSIVMISIMTLPGLAASINLIMRIVKALKRKPRKTSEKADDPYSCFNYDYYTRRGIDEEFRRYKATNFRDEPILFLLYLPALIIVGLGYKYLRNRTLAAITYLANIASIIGFICL